MEVFSPLFCEVESSLQIEVQPATVSMRVTKPPEVKAQVVRTPETSGWAQKTSRGHNIDISK